MQFTRLRLQGFKSFVDPSELVISTGLTGVVGPNGCGKSNLLEALRWVMGENRAKAMRGDGMEDVIFAGTDSRPARGSASVELAIDNSERLAPAAFNTEDRLEISRRITRDIGSAFNVNGKTVRARDVQMLFADASTGAHSPALVRQGQIAELINAKPKARRRILEEAAGISGLYQRRHEAELKLNGAEANLARVDDVVDGLDGRLRALERQAAQARRYREIKTELRRAEAALLFLRWKGAEDERHAAETALTDLTRAAAEAERLALEAGRARDRAEAALPPLREEEAIASAVHQRLAIEQSQLKEAEARARAAIEALGARAEQIARDVEREEALSADALRSIERLEAEESEIRAEHACHDARASEAGDAARAAAAALVEREAALDRLTEEAARLTARAAAAERRLEEARTAIARIEAETAKASATEAELVVAIERADAALDAAKASDARARDEGARSEHALDAAETERTAAQSAEADARARASGTEGERAALAAEVRALEKLLAREDGREAQILDRVTVEPGYEAALGAALGDDLRASEIEPGVAATGWLALEAYGDTASLPDGAAALAARVTAPARLARRMARIGLVDRAEGDRLQGALGPGQRLVSREGDLWRWDGFRMHADDASSTAALRLEQQNRLKTMAGALETATRASAAAAGAQRAARVRLDEATAAETAARQARRVADAALADAARALSRAEADLDMGRGKLETQRLTLASRLDEHAAAAAALSEADAGIADLGDVGAARAAVEAERATVETARSAMHEARARSDAVRRDGEAREKRLGEIDRERQGWRERQAGTARRIAELAERAEATLAEQARAVGKPDEIAAGAEGLVLKIGEAESRRKAAGDALATAEEALRNAENAGRETERRASERREARARAEAVLDGAVARVAEAAERIREDMGLAPDRLLEAVGAEDMTLPTLDAAEADVTRLRRQRDALGAVNLRAEEDAEDLRTERDGLSEEKADLEAAICKLRHGIGELNREGRQRLIAAFDSVNEKFARLFRHLFGGGEARLIMVESEDPLDAGLEILCQPPGKKLASLSLLSGGEQTLTALSLIFAVFLSNPAPICVLDEVDAPLDDANVTRFCDLLDEMRRLTETRFLIITHHAITMSRMDRLFGVTMVERGVSQLVSVDLVRAAELVDA